MKRFPTALLSRSSLPDDVWHERQRWLLWILWAHVGVLAVYAVAQGHLAGNGGAFSIAAAACALLASLRFAPPRGRALLVALGLMSASVALGELWPAEAEAGFHASLVIVLLMLYEDSALLVLAVLYIAGQFAVRNVALDMAIGPTLFAAGVALGASSPST